MPSLIHQPTACKGRSSSYPYRATIYAVIVVADPALEAPFVNVFCNNLFQTVAGGTDLLAVSTLKVNAKSRVERCTWIPEAESGSGALPRQGSAQSRSAALAPARSPVF